MRRLWIISLIILPALGIAQQKPKPNVQEGQFTFDTDKPFSLLDLDKKIEEPIVTKKKKPKRKVFYGIKTKKGFTRKGYGARITVELFYYLKKPDKPSTFARDIFWYDFTRREIRKTTAAGFDQKRGVLLHGPYKKMQGTIVLEEGIFYKGTRHAVLFCQCRYAYHYFTEPSRAQVQHVGFMIFSLYSVYSEMYNTL